MTTIEKGPKTLDGQLMLKEMLRGEQLPSVVGKELGITGKRASHLVVDMRAYGSLPRLSPGEKERQKRESTSFSRGAEWLSTRPYLGLGLLDNEIGVAMKIAWGERYKPNNVQANLSRMRHRHPNEVPRRTPEERKLVRRIGRQPKEVTHASVALILEAVTVFIRDGDLEQVPVSRSEWESLAQELESRDLITSNGEQWQQLVMLYDENGRFMPLHWTAENMAREREFIARIAQGDRVGVNIVDTGKAPAQTQSQLSIEERDGQFLTELEAARAEWKASGNRGIYSIAIDRIDALDSSFIERRRREIGEIRDGNQVTKTNEEVAAEVVKRGGLALHGETTHADRQGS